LSGFPERLTFELCKKLELSYLQPTTSPLVKVLSQPERRYMPWIGSSILGSLSWFQEKWFAKENYDELGPSGLTFNLDIEIPE
jgi:actin-related protein